MTERDWRVKPDGWRRGCFCADHPRYMCNYHLGYSEGWKDAVEGWTSDNDIYRRCFEWLTTRLGFDCTIGDVDPGEFIDGDETPASDAWLRAILAELEKPADA